jgi:hypothetical protein
MKVENNNALSLPDVLVRRRLGSWLGHTTYRNSTHTY